MSVTEEQVLQTVREELATQLSIPAGEITATDQLDLLPRADSVRLMRAVAGLEDAFHTEFDDDEIRSADTVQDLVALVLAALPPVARP